MVKDASYGQMAVLMKGIFRIIISMDKEHMLGLMEENSWENGRIIRWMDLENLYGKMEENIKENT